MNIRPQDVMLYAGGECFQKFGTPIWRMSRAQDVAGVHTRSGAVGSFIDKDGILRSASANRLRTEWVGGVPHLSLEEARTNVALWNRDLTNAVWTATTCTVAKTQTGVDGSANAASLLTATAGNATVLQAITLGSSVRYQSAYVKRITGSGTIEMTLDNGSTWTAITLTALWSRVTVPTQTLANPTVGFRIVTNADAIAVDFVQNENGKSATSAIATTTVAVTRNVDTFYSDFLHPPQEMTVYLKFIERGATDINASRLFHIGSATQSADPRFLVFVNSGVYSIAHDNGTTSISADLSTTPSVGDTVEIRAVLNANGSILVGQTIEGGTEELASDATVVTLQPAWAGPRIYINSGGSTGMGVSAFASVKVVRDVQTMADLRALFAYEAAA